MSNPIHQSQPPQAAVDQIIGLYNQGQLEQTVSLAESLANQYPNALILYDILGAAYMGLKNTEKTIASYQKALQLNPNHTDAYNNMGMALYDKGRFDEAVESYQKAIKLEPSFADAHYNLGNALKQTGDLKQAIESYEASLAINPNDAEVLLSYGNALKDYGDFDQATEVYAKVLKVDPSLTAAQTNMDNADEEKAEIDKLVADYARITKLEISSADVVRMTGTFLKAKGYLDAAIDTYKQAIKIKPDYAEAHINIGNALSEKGELNAAIGSYNQALKIKPDYFEAYINIGNALQVKGELDAAIDNYKQALKIKPDQAEMYYKLGNILENRGEIESAIEIYKQSPQITSDVTVSPNKFFGVESGFENYIKNKDPSMTAVSVGSYYFDHFGNEFYEGRLLKVISQLNEIVFDSNEEMWGNICYTRKKAHIDFINMFPQQILGFKSRRRNIARIAPHIDSIFEIGVNAGHSAVLWLMMNPNIKYFGLDIFNYEYQRSCSNFLKAAFGERFNVFVGDSRIEVPTINEKINQKIDLIHVDGGHTFELANSDLLNSIEVSKKLQTKFILLDDIDDSRVKKAGDEFVTKGLLHVDDLGSSWELISNSLFRIL